MPTPNPTVPVRANPRTISETLKEAIVDGLLNTVVGRLSGRGDSGCVIFGTKPRNALSSGFLLPYDPTANGDENSTSIRISGHGLDMLVAASSTEKIKVKPRCAIYVRVFPTMEEILNHPNCDPKFSLLKPVAQQMRLEIRKRAEEAAKKLTGGKRNPEWGAIDQAIRKSVHAEFGVPFGPSESEETGGEESGIEGETPEEGEAGSGVKVSGRASLPDHLATESPVPQKWLRLDVELPLLEFGLDEVRAAADMSNVAIREAISKRLLEWTTDEHPVTGGKLWGYRRCRKIKPSDVKDWNRFLEEVRSSGLKVVTPEELKLEWDIEVNTDYLNPTCRSVHVALENRSEDPKPSSYTFKETELAVFQVSLEITVSKLMHRPLMLDRVEPSYRFYEYLAYPALGFNGGVEKSEQGEFVVLNTTWAPRYYQPRIIPTSLADKGVEANIEALSRPDCLTGLKPLVSCYKDWLKGVEKFPFDAGIDKNQKELIGLERDKFSDDKEQWAGELAAIETGISILEESATYWKGPGAPSDRRAIPFEAWLAMNETMAEIGKRKGYAEWRLFQLAFILANLPALVTRMPEFHSRYTPAMKKYSDSVTLLYFATGGGKSEAFLGLLVFSLFLDRLRGKERGVTALLRYPLRLLTLQQAQRTAKTLAQAELVRRNRKHPGETFSIGFWVGSANTPNSLSDEDVKNLPEVDKFPANAESKLLDTITYARAVERWNKLPECPFCASDKGTGLRRFPSHGGLLGHLCLNNDCSWNKGHKNSTPLPFYIVDEDIYELPPSVLLGTVDKLALIGQSQRTIRRFLGMFGFAPGYKASTGRLYLPDDKNRAELSQDKATRPFIGLFPTYADGEKRFFDPFPALLIQDEAHLLDESLGTFAGLFETAMDAALDELGALLGAELAIDPHTATRRRVKVIAASATVSDPRRQMENIYQRGTVQFPHPGPELYRSFYAAPKGPGANEIERHALPERDVEGRSHWSRVYQSILTNGHTHTVTVVEVLAEFHVAITALYERLKSGDATKVADARAMLLSELSNGSLQPLFERELASASSSDLATLIDLHRIALTYVTNKKGGDQIMAAEGTEFEKKHLQAGLPGFRLETDLITGAIDAGHIQDVIRRAEYRPKPGEALVGLNESLRSIVATSAVSHGVDVEELNSMFFAGMPSDIAEYIQASSRVGRTHVGFCVLIPTPQRARDRYIVEVHDIFHRFLERMLAPAAIDRWAEKAVERVIASFLQEYLCGVRAIKRLAEAPESEKSKQRNYKWTREAKEPEKEGMLAFKRDISQFIEAATGLRLPYAPTQKSYYEGLIRSHVNTILDDMSMPRFDGSELGNFLTGRNIELRPMMSLRDVDKPGRIVPSNRDARDSRKVGLEQITRTMRFIRGGSGSTIDDEDMS